MPQTHGQSVHDEANPPILLPSRIDFYAQIDPRRSLLSILKSRNLEDGYIDVTFGQFANAVNRAAFWLDKELGSLKDSRVFTFFGPGDLRCPILAVAGIKTGRMLQLCSPTMLSPTGRAQILDAVNCQIILRANTDEASHLWEDLRTARPKIRSVVVPQVGEWLNDDAHASYPYEKLPEHAKNDPVIGFHSSGTTGNPKPITHTNQSFMTIPTFYDRPLQGRPTTLHNYKGQRVLHSFSYFHAAGILYGLLLPVFVGYTAVQPSPYIPLQELSGRAVADMIRQSRASHVSMKPAMLESIANDQELLPVLDQLKTISWAAAPLSETVGNFLSQKHKLVCSFGTTEVLLLSVMPSPEKQDWAYVKICPEMGCTFREHGQGRYELVIERKPDLEKFQAIFVIFPHNDIYETHDLWSPHPTLPDYWRHQGRSDDMVALDSGKLLVTGHELKLREHPQVKAAVIGGDRKPKPFLVVEPADEVKCEQVEKASDMVDQVWPAVEKVNEELEGSFEITKDHTFVVIDEALPRTTKGEVSRPKTMDMYKDEVDKMYTRECDLCVPTDDRGRS